jgi:hypothetical protein
MKMSDFDYKKYSLEQLENWVHDAVSGDATPQEIYNAIRKVVQEQYDYHEQNSARSKKLLRLLDGCKELDLNLKDIPYFNNNGENYYREEYKGSTVSSVKPDKVKKWVLPVEETKIAETDETEYFITFPDDLLEAADLKEGDQIEWVDNKDGTYTLRKETK